MQVLINIPDDVYKNIKNGEDIKIHYGDYIVINDKWGSEIIRKGTPLPKGHSDLVDVEKLYDEMYDIEVDGVSRSVVNYETILNARKIIHADKENKE